MPAPLRSATARCVFSLLVLLSFIPSVAAQIELVADLNPGEASSSPAGFSVNGGLLHFFASTPEPGLFEISPGGLTPVRLPMDLPTELFFTGAPPVAVGRFLCFGVGYLVSPSLGVDQLACYDRDTQAVTRWPVTYPGTWHATTPPVVVGSRIYAGVRLGGHPEPVDGGYIAAYDPLAGTLEEIELTPERLVPQGLFLFEGRLFTTADGPSSHALYRLDPLSRDVAVYPQESCNGQFLITRYTPHAGRLYFQALRDADTVCEGRWTLSRYLPEEDRIEEVPVPESITRQNAPLLSTPHGLYFGGYQFAAPEGGWLYRHDAAADTTGPVLRLHEAGMETLGLVLLNDDVYFSTSLSVGDDRRDGLFSYHPSTGLTHVRNSPIEEVQAPTPRASFDGRLFLSGFTTRTGRELFAYTPATTSTSAAAEARTALSPLFPNPSYERASLLVSVGRPQQVRIGVHDLLGRKVAVVHEGALAEGAHTLTLDTTHLAPGAYLVHATGEGWQVTRPFTVVR